MPRPVRPWFRIYVEMFPDRKIRRLTPEQRWAWVAVLGAARESPESGQLFVAPGVPITVEELADYAALSVRKMSTALDAMEALGIVARNADGVIEVPNFLARQYESDNATARTRAFRERSNERGRNVPTNEVGTFQRRSREQGRNGPETETETEVNEEAKNASSSGAHKRATTRGTRLAEDWRPSEADGEWLREAGISELLARTELPKFVNYWLAKSGQGATKVDWSRTWRNWLLTAQERQPRIRRASEGGERW